MIKATHIEIVKIDSIKLNPENRNKHPKEQVDRLAEILTYQGFRRPVTISNRTGHLVCGEGRYLAAKQLKLTEIPAMFQDYDTPEQEFADAIADNAVDKWSNLDWALLDQDMRALGPEFDLDLLGLKNFSIEPPVIKNTSTELDLENFEKFQHECPKCGFEWNDDGTT